MKMDKNTLMLGGVALVAAVLYSKSKAATPGNAQALLPNNSGGAIYGGSQVYAGSQALGSDGGYGSPFSGGMSNNFGQQLQQVASQFTGGGSGTTGTTGTGYTGSV